MNKIQSEKQFKLSVFPYMYCDLISENGDLSLCIYNQSNYPASDVHVDILHVYDKDDIDIHSFVLKFVKKEFRDTNVMPNEDGFYITLTATNFRLFPEKCKKIVQLNAPLTDSIYVCLQYRDIFGSNYARLYWFINDNWVFDENNYYKFDLKSNFDIDFIKPSTLETYEKFILFESEQVPDFINKSIQEHYSKDNVIESYKLDKIIPEF